MKNIACYVLWGFLVLLLISFSTSLLEKLLHVGIHHYIINTVFVLALVALHYFKFRKSWIQIHSLTHKILSCWLYRTHPPNSLKYLGTEITFSLISIMVALTFAKIVCDAKFQPKFRLRDEMHSPLPPLHTSHLIFSRVVCRPARISSFHLW